MGAYVRRVGGFERLFTREWTHWTFDKRDESILDTVGNRSRWAYASLTTWRDPFATRQRGTIWRDKRNLFVSCVSRCVTASLVDSYLLLSRIPSEQLISICHGTRGRAGIENLGRELSNPAHPRWRRSRSFYLSTLFTLRALKSTRAVSAAPPRIRNYPRLPWPMPAYPPNVRRNAVLIIICKWDVHVGDTFWHMSMIGF